MRAAAGVAAQPLSDLLKSYPTLNAPGMTNQSTQHMQEVSKRANTSAGRSSVLRDYLSTA
jgi:hypothetical protein